MVILYHHAIINNLMVVGAANKTELLTGTFSQWGCDQCADVMPVIHLYRTQLEALAEYLKIPDCIRSKPADPDIIPGVDDKGELLGSFYIADQILWGFEHGVSDESLRDRFGIVEVDRISNLYEASRFMREAPYSMESVPP
jgi:NAD+ synthase